MKAIILAAGVGRRFGPLTEHQPKCLLQVGHLTLLELMLDALQTVAREAVIVVGHRQDLIRDLVGERFGRLPVRYVENPDYTKGSLRSLWAARHEIKGDCLVMDADVLFATELIERLVSAEPPSAFLLDEKFTDTGEEIKLYALGERVVAMGKTTTPPQHDRVGEGVGFFKCAAAHGSFLIDSMRELLAESTREREYEDALDRMLSKVHVGWVAVDGLPWTEIDFPEDLRRAREEVLQRIQRAIAPP